MKQSGMIALAAVLLILAGCEARETDRITVISREDGSGTRSAFVELMGIEQENSDGEMEDMTRPDAEVTNSTGIVMMSVAGDKNGIGYISLGSMNDTVKALGVDGVYPTAESIAAGEYAVSRPFVLCWKGEPDALSQDFIRYVMSSDGQAVIAGEKYIPVGGTDKYSSRNMSGTVTINGSTSVAPVMERLAEYYEQLNPKAKVEIQQTGSGAGIMAAVEGVCGIGMSSRTLTQEELDSGLTALTIANDGIVLIVSHDNPLTDLASSDVMKIYTGEISLWSDTAEYGRENA